MEIERRIQLVCIGEALVSVSGFVNISVSVNLNK